MQAQEGICPLCGRRMLMDKLKRKTRHLSPYAPTIDHVLPVSLGGYSRHGNCLAVHRICNERKGNRFPTGCEIIWLVAVCERIGQPVRLVDNHPWVPPALAFMSPDRPASQQGERA